MCSVVCVVFSMCAVFSMWSVACAVCGVQDADADVGCRMVGMGGVERGGWDEMGWGGVG